MSAHTPGPWMLLPEECDKPYVRVRGAVPGGRFKVANVLAPVYEGVHEREAKETRANARLIAAAPDTTEALRGLLNLYVELVNSGDAGHWDAEKVPEVVAARYALAKAGVKS